MSTRSSFILLCGCALLAACDGAAPIEPTAARRPSFTINSSTMAEDAVRGALGNAATGVPYIVSMSSYGAERQLAISQAGPNGFPTEGQTYLVLSSGDATRAPQGQVSNDAIGAGCELESSAPKCDEAELKVTLQLPASTSGLLLQFDVRYFTSDQAPNQDPVVVELRDPAGNDHVVYDDAVSKAFPTSSSIGLFQWAPAISKVSADVTAFAGQVVELRIKVADTDLLRLGGGYYDSGVAIDNLQIVPKRPPDAAAPKMTVSASGTFVPYGQKVKFTAALDDSRSGESTITTALYRLNSGMLAPMTFSGPESATRTATVELGPYSTPAAHTLCMRGGDAAGNQAAEQCIEFVTYDPEQNYVIGTGSFYSNKTAFTESPSAEGRAQFAMVTQTGRSGALEGSTRFRFRFADLEFESTGYDYLLTDGSKGRYKGRGRLYVNGAARDATPAGNHILRVSVIDGTLTGVKNASDYVRFRITERLADGTESVIYDNHQALGQPTLMPDDAPAQSALTGGNIHLKAPTTGGGGSGSTGGGGSKGGGKTK
jgi:hypothetical protein